MRNIPLCPGRAGAAHLRGMCEKIYEQKSRVAAANDSYVQDQDENKHITLTRAQKCIAAELLLNTQTVC